MAETVRLKHREATVVREMINQYEALCLDAEKRIEEAKADPEAGGPLAIFAAQSQRAFANFALDVIANIALRLAEAGDDES
jgi:hypothetical protein